MELIFLQVFFLSALTLLSGYGLLGISCYFLKIKPSTVVVCFGPATCFPLGLILLALSYAFLGLINHLETIYLTVIILLLGGIGCYLLGWKLILQVLKSELYIPNWRSLLLIILLLPVLIYGIGISLLPTSNWDAISYVLNFPKTHIADGNIRYLSEYGIFSAFPVYGEAVIGFPLLLFKNEQVVQAYCFIFFINLLFISRHLFKCFSNSELYIFLAQISIAYLPIILINLGIAKIDIPQSSIILSSILLLNIGDTNLRKLLKFLSILLFVFGIGLKYTTIFYLPIYILSYLATEKDKSSRQILIDVAQFFVFGIIINVFWLFKNIVEHCNPIFPNLIKYLGSCMYPRDIMAEIMLMVSESTFLQKGTSYQSTQSITAYLPFFTEAVGLINTSLIFIVIIIFIIERYKSITGTKLNFLFYGVAISFIFQIFFLLWEFRYFIFVIVLTIIIIFIALSYLYKIRFIEIIITGLVLFQIYHSISIFHSKNSYIFLPLSGKITLENYKEGWVHLYWVAKYINQNTHPDAVVAFNWGVQPFYYLDRKYFFIHDWNPEGSIQEMRSPEEFLDLLMRKKCSYLVWRNQDETRFQDPSISKLFHAKTNEYLASLVSTGNLKSIFTKDDVVIYKIFK